MAEKQYLDYPGLEEVILKIKEKYAPIQAVQYKGSVATISSLPTVAAAKVGDMYNVETGGTTTADFVEGAGHKLSDGANVVAVNTETDETLPAVMKWDVFPGVFNIEDRLQFGFAMPETGLTNGRVFLYLGNTTYTFDAVADPTGHHPKAEGWYEIDEPITTPATYHLTNDEDPQIGTTYFQKNEEYVQGVIYEYNETEAKWIAKNSGDTFVPITKAQIDALFE